MEFFDQFEHTIDDKGRLVLPAAYREAFVGGGFLTLLGDNAALFTKDGWDTYRRKLALSGNFTRHQLQFLYGSASPFVPDAQHRIVVNARVRAKAGLGKEVIIVGSGSHAAIYPRDTWAEIEAEVTGPDAEGLTLTDKINALDFL
jgi:MraZ protein